MPFVGILGVDILRIVNGTFLDFFELIRLFADKMNGSDPHASAC